MYVVFLAGGIASGKSTVARELERLGAWRVDLDQISREVLEPGTTTTRAIADAFGEDLLDPETGELNRALLAARAFASPEATALLEQIELPAIEERLIDVLTRERCAEREPVCCIVEVPLLDRVGQALELADEVLYVAVPLDERRRRAVGRGMTEADFDARASKQPSDEWLRAHADAIINNEGSSDELVEAVRAWWHAHEQNRWQSPRREADTHA